MTQEEFKNRYQYNPATDKLGESGSGNTFKAYDTHRDCWVALKISKVNPDYESIRLKRAAETAAQLPSHPNIAVFGDCYTFTSFDGEYDFGIQQYYEQGNLSQLLKQGGLSSAQKQSILVQILSGIEFLHNNGIIHCNLKPQNILIVKRGEEYIPKITDFGGSITGMGNLSYASPEQLGNNAVYQNADLWSFGVIAYRTLTGELPFTAGEYAVTSEAGQLELLRQINSGQPSSAIIAIAEPWRQLIRDCLVPDPEKRVKNCKECIAALKGDTHEDAKPQEIRKENTAIETPKMNLKPKSESETIPKLKLNLNLNLNLKLEPQFVKRIFGGIAAGIAMLLLVLFITGKSSSTSDKKYISIEIDGKYGLRDKKGKEIIPCKYSFIILFSESEGLATVKLNGKYGFIDKSSKQVIPFQYDEAWKFSEGLAVVQLNDKCGFIDKKGKQIIPCIYDDAGFFSEGLAYIELNDKYGFIDKKGNQIIPCIYDNAGSFSEGLAYVELNDKYGFIDKKGKQIIPCIYDKVKEFSEKFACVKLKGKWGYIDKTGGQITPCIYSEAEKFSEGFAGVKSNGKWGYIDKTGKEVIPCIYDDNVYFFDFAGNFSEGFARVKLNNKYGFIDKTGKQIISCIHDDIGSFSEGLVYVVVNGKYGFMDRKGKLIIPCIYDAIKTSFGDLIFPEGFICAKLNGKWGYMNKTGKEVIPFKYDEVGTYFTEGLTPVNLNDKWGFMDKTGKEVIACQYDKVMSFNRDLHGLAWVKLDNKGHYIDKNGIRWKYEEAYGLSEGLALVISNGKYGYIDEDMNEVIPLKYDNAGHFSEGLAPVALNGYGCGFIDKTGNEVIPLKYNSVNSFSGGIALVLLNGKWFYIDKTGKYVK